MKVGRAFRLLAALFALTIAGSSCTQDVATGPEVAVTPAPTPELDPSLLGGLLGGVTRLVGTLLTCEPQPFEAAQAVIGPNGGVLRFGDNFLIVPRGALTRNVTIRAELPRDTVASVRFFPHGLEFEKPVALTLSYEHCNLVAGLLTPKRIAYTTEGLLILEYVPTFDNILRRNVTGRLDHFSRYAVSW